MQCSGYGKAERCDDGIEAVTVLGHHLIAALHAADTGRQQRSAGVDVVLARCDQRLFADDAGATHFLHVAVAVGDDPVSRQQLRATSPLFSMVTV